MDELTALYIQVAQLSANVGIILWLLKYYIKKIESTIKDIEELANKLYKDRVKLNIIGEYLSKKDKEFNTLWSSIKNNSNGYSDFKL